MHVHVHGSHDPVDLRYNETCRRQGDLPGVPGHVHCTACGQPQLLTVHAQYMYMIMPVEEGDKMRDDLYAYKVRTEIQGIIDYFLQISGFLADVLRKATGD